ncbi:MAG: PhoPQ-activated pathogenicity-related family protein [Gemmataceae bacterium]|nr:PhoPQ-activated pathogenicity-related family protein [Gemmataceae bacterium]
MLRQLLFPSCFCTTLLLGLTTTAIGDEPARKKRADEIAAAARSPLDDYIQQKDDAFAWNVAKTIEGKLESTYIIKLTSQKWRGEKDVDRTAWEHWLVVVKPKNLTTKKVFLHVGGGANDRPMPAGADLMTLTIARNTGSIVAELRMIPNQPLVFNGDGEKRSEDNLIAYGWDQFIKTGDATWLPRLPMVKAVVKAMDCLEQWAAKEGIAIEGFVVAGGSKRGWTTWLAGAVDPRVEAIIPIVIDVANVDTSMRHHAQAYGFWAKAIGDYYRHGIMQRWDHPRLIELYKIEDPYHYRKRLTLPKYIVNASGDQFFLPDSSQFYFEDLIGEKHLRYVPNADHSLRGSDALEGIIAYYQLIVTGKPRPRYSWTFEKDGSIAVTSETPVKSALLWQANNPKARDFRLMTIGKAYKSVALEENGKGKYVAKLEAPADGWTASFIELQYDTGGAFPLKLSTAVRVLPDRLPFPKVDPKKVPYEGAIAPPGK